MRLASLLGEQLSNLENANFHKNVIAIGDNIEALALEVLLERNENWENAVQVLERKVELPRTRTSVNVPMMAHLPKPV